MGHRSRRRGAAIAAGLAATLIPAAIAIAALGDLTPRTCIVDVGNPDCPTPANGLDQPKAVVVSADGTSVYTVASLDSAVARFLRAGSGALTRGGCIDDPGPPPACPASTTGLAGANGLAVSADGKNVYAISGRAVVRFSRNPASGGIKALDCIGSPACGTPVPGLVGGAEVAVSPDGNSVYVAAETADAIVRFDRGPGGALTPRGCVQDTDTANPVCASFAEGLDGAFSLAISANGRSLYTSSIGDHAIARFNRGPAGALTPAGCIADDGSAELDCARRITGLRLPLHIALSPGDTSLYSLGHLDHAVTLLRRNAATGALTPGGCIELAGSPAGCATSAPTGIELPAGIATSGDGDSVYVTGGESDAVVNLARAANGSLSFVSCVEDDQAQLPTTCPQSTAGLGGPGGVAVSPDGRSVYVVSRDDAIVELARALAR